MSLTTAKIGNAAYICTLLSVFLYVLAVLSGWSGLDPVWKEAGFCIMNPDKDYWTSHDFCLYFDTLTSAIMAILWYKLRNCNSQDANEMMRNTILGHLGHGLAHGGIARAIRKDEWLQDEVSTRYDVYLHEQWPIWEFLWHEAGAVLFWSGLLYGCMRGNHIWKVVGLSTIIVVVDVLFVPIVFGFTYVQTVLFLVASICELSRDQERKGFEYALMPCLVLFPSTLVAWAECTQCSNGFRVLGGHVVYDIYYPVSTIPFYLVCWWRFKLQQDVSLMKKVA